MQIIATMLHSGNSKYGLQIDGDAPAKLRNPRQFSAKTRSQAIESGAMATQIEARNVLGKPMRSCSSDPLTGWYRDGCCNTGPGDIGQHTVCARMTAEFLAFSYQRGNDLSTPRPEFGFPGLQPGDRWCLCVERWVEAFESGAAPLVDLEACHISVLEYVDLDVLRQFAITPSAV
jgi:uncharacterized protein